MIIELLLLLLPIGRQLSKLILFTFFLFYTSFLQAAPYYTDSELILLKELKEECQNRIDIVIKNSFKEEHCPKLKIKDSSSQKNTNCSLLSKRNIELQNQISILDLEQKELYQIIDRLKQQSKKNYSEQNNEYNTFFIIIIFVLILAITLYYINEKKTAK